MNGREELLVWWLLGFAACHGAIGLWCRIRGRKDRVTIRRIRQRGIGPVAAAGQAGDERDAARTAVLLLIKAEAVEVSNTGMLTAVADAPEPDDRMMSELLDGIRRWGAKGVPVRRILDRTGFEEFWSRVDGRAPGVRRYAEDSRVIAYGVGMVVGFAMPYHALKAEVPFFGADPDWWLLALWPSFFLFSFTAVVWPDEHSRRWRRFNTFCRSRADTALEGLPDRIRDVVDARVFQPVSPRARLGSSRVQPSARRGKTRSHGGPSDTGGAGWGDDSASSCGGCGCGGE
ncbi:hypothetical protein [Streptomyces qinzhouensis]|uniref:hypothetical protein n=1 Tax=Streptomyces qinzhouensis TaxID=2599401 RepID=UPI00164463F6|nr:hypothetical protein [Streptomyces qinzhouensis]